MALRATGEPRTKLDREVLIVFPGLMLAMMLAALDQTIVTTALPTIVTELGGLTHLSWVVTAYLLGSCISTPIYGKLGDLFGRKRLFQFAIVLFLLGSVLSGTAWSMTSLIAFRAVQGIGAGGLMVNSQAIIGDLVPPAERGRYQGFMQSVFAFSTLAGPLLGGVITEHLSWRWVFYVNLPVGAVALVVIGLVLRLPPRQRRRPRIDWWGAFLLSTGAACLILVTSTGGTTLPWASAPLVLLAVATVVLLTLFVLVERRAPEPLLPLQLFRHRGFRITIAMTFVVGFGMLGVTTFNPLYQQIVVGVSPTLAGLRLSPLVLVMMLTSVLVGHAITRSGRYKRYPVAGTALLVVAMALMSLLGVHTPYWFQLIALAAVGLSFGMINSVLLLSVQNSVGPADVGVATSTNTFARTIGSSVGVAAFGAIFATQLTAAVRVNLPPEVAGSFAATGVNLGRAQIDALPAPLRDGLLESFAGALHTVFLGGVVIAVIGFALALRLPELPLRTRADAPPLEAAEP